MDKFVWGFFFGKAFVRAAFPADDEGRPELGWAPLAAA